MKRSAALAVLLSVTSVLAAGVREAASGLTDPDGLIAHEWGTFTTVAGADGNAVDWLPLSGPQDLPCFVERYHEGTVIKGLAGAVPLTYEQARTRLPGKVRMETPVVYLYSRLPTTAEVRVRFPRGVITEWYPRAKVTQYAVTPSALRSSRVGLIEWRGVKVTPEAGGRFPTETAASHYYAARDTDASPLEVNGQREKFLFYRGLGGFDVPISVVAAADGSVRVTNLGRRPLGGVVLFRNIDGRRGYRVHGTLTGEATLAAPSATVDPALVRDELERILTDAGLYAREARAMVATWRDSWFEEGTRVFYVLPPGDVDDILPLSIDPRPVQIARVFVGRMEVITAQALDSVRRAIAAGDRAGLERHGRFLGPISDRLAGAAESESARARISEAANAALAAYAHQTPPCR